MIVHCFIFIAKVINEFGHHYMAVSLLELSVHILRLFFFGVSAFHSAGRVPLSGLVGSILSLSVLNRSINFEHVSFIKQKFLSLVKLNSSTF